MDAGIRRPRWGFLEIVLVYIGILAIGVLFGVFGKEFYFDIIRITGIPDNEFGYFVVSFIIQFLATIGLVFLFTIWLHKGKLSDLGIRNTKLSNYLKYGILGGILLFIIVVILGIVIQHFNPNLEPQVYESILRSVTGQSGFITILIIGAVLAPLSEELFYRGMIYPVFRKHFGPIGGAILAGAVFGLSHWDLWRSIPLAIGGAILCYIYEKTGSIFVSAFAHGMWNGVMSLIIYVSILQL